MSLQYQESPQDILAPATGYAGQFSVQTYTQHLANLYPIYKEGGIHISLQRKKITLVYIFYQNTSRREKNARRCARFYLWIQRGSSAIQKKPNSEIKQKEGSFQ